MRSTGIMGTLEIIAFFTVIGWMIYGSSQSFKKAQRKKEMEHAERMKWLEMGLAPPVKGLDWPAAMVCIAVGAGVPIGSFLVAWLACLTADVPSQIWLAPVFVSFAALGTTRKLTVRLIENRTSMPQKAGRSIEKLAFDPEAFDLVGNRI